MCSKVTSSLKVILQALWINGNLFKHYGLNIRIFFPSLGFLGYSGLEEDLLFPNMTDKSEDMHFLHLNT